MSRHGRTRRRWGRAFASSPRQPPAHFQPRRPGQAGVRTLAAATALLLAGGVGALVTGAAGDGRGAGGSAPPVVTMATPVLEARASEIVDQLAAQDFDAVRSDFDPLLRDRLSEARLAGLWRRLTTEYGAFTGKGTPVLAVTGRARVDQVPFAFERGARKLRVTFDAGGRVTGLFVVRQPVE